MSGAGDGTTYLERLDPLGLHWLLRCRACQWRVLIDDDTDDTAHAVNYVAAGAEHSRSHWSVSVPPPILGA